MQTEDLLNYLGRYETYGKTDAVDIAVMQAFLASYGNSAFERRHDLELKHPKYGATVGHMVETAWIVDTEVKPAKVLMIFHNILQRWLAPGGHCDLEDAFPGDAALREAMEETGLQKPAVLTPCLFDLDIHPIPANPKKSEPEHLHLGTTWLIPANSNVGLMLQEAEVSACEWVSIENLNLDNDPNGSFARLQAKTLAL